MAKFSWVPDFTAIGPFSETHVKDWIEAMDWARLEVELDTLKSEFMKWVNYVQVENVSNVSKLPTWHFQTVGRVALLLNKGATPTTETMTWFVGKVQALIDLAPEPVVVEEKVEEINACLNVGQRRVLEYVDFYSFIDAVRVKFALDEAELEARIVERLRTRSPSKILLKKLYQHYKESLADATNEKDNVEVAKTIDPLIVVVNVLADFTGNTKIAGKTKKSATKERKVNGKAPIKGADVGTNVASVDPATIPGSEAVVMFNTKTRKATVYSAKADTKLTVKGTKLIGFDEVKSFAKTLRLPKAVLPSLRNATSGARATMVMNTYVKGKSHTVNGRINKDTVVIKVFK